MDIRMNKPIVFATSLAFSAIALGASTASAQNARESLSALREREQVPCSLNSSEIDSARVDALSILFSNHPLTAQLRHEQGIPASASQLSVTAIRDGSLCRRLASQFNRTLPSTSRLAVLRVGSMYYARDPDQRRTTGIFADSTFHVVMRLGAAIDK
jgi:hypothetical protein